MLLSKTDLQALTGYKLQAKQIQWLKKNGFKFAVGADGAPKVLQSYIEDIMGSPAHKQARRMEPNFDAL